jgi:hypothetical protein
MAATTLADHNWIVLIAAAVLLFSAVQGITTGRTTLFYRTVTRSEDPTLYWPAVAGSAILGIAVALTLIL